MTDNFGKPANRRSITLEAPQVETPQETLDRLRLEVAELRASRERLVLAADADRRGIERDLHDGLQQHLVALAVNLQLARRLADTDPRRPRRSSTRWAATCSRRWRRRRRSRTGSTRRCSRWAGSRRAALRSAVVSTGSHCRVEVTAAATYPPEVAGTVYLCCLEALELVGAGRGDGHGARRGRRSSSSRSSRSGAGSPVRCGLDRLRDRVEALGGRLTIGSKPGAGTRVSGSLPLSR